MFKNVAQLSLKCLHLSLCLHAKKNVFPLQVFKTLVTTLRPASPGFATWHIGGFGVFYHFGDFLPIWQFWQLFWHFFGPF